MFLVVSFVTKKSKTVYWRPKGGGQKRVSVVVFHSFSETGSVLGLRRPQPGRGEAKVDGVEVLQCHPSAARALIMQQSPNQAWDVITQMELQRRASVHLFVCESVSLHHSSALCVCVCVCVCVRTFIIRGSMAGSQLPHTLYECKHRCLVLSDDVWCRALPRFWYHPKNATDESGWKEEEGGRRLRREQGRAQTFRGPAAVTCKQKPHEVAC